MNEGCRNFKIFKAVPCAKLQNNRWIVRQSAKGCLILCRTRNRDLYLS
jgi:hypothetical protein